MPEDDNPRFVIDSFVIRVGLLAVVAFLMFSILVIRLWNMQVIRSSTGPGSFYLQCQMGDNAAWPLIESMSMTISDAGHPSAYPFGVIRDGMTVSTGVPTSLIAMSEESTFTSDGDTLLYYDFTIEIVFSNIDIQADPNWERLSSFEGTQFVFVFVPS